MKIYVLKSNGVVQRAKIKKKNLKKYQVVENAYIYHGIYNGIYFQRSRVDTRQQPASTRRSHHKANLYVKKKSKKDIVPIVLDFYYRQKNDNSEYAMKSPGFYRINQTFYLDAKVAKQDVYIYHDFGNYDESWKNGLISDIFHWIMYQPSKGLMEGEYRLWQVDYDIDRIAVEDPIKDTERHHVHSSVDGLIEDILVSMEEEYGQYASEGLQ